MKQAEVQAEPAAARPDSRVVGAPRSAWGALEQQGVSWWGRFGNGLRAAVAWWIVWTLHYLRMQLELHVRRPLRSEPYLVMRLFRLVSRRFPVTVAYPNPLSPGRPLIMALDLCRTHVEYFRQRARYERDWLRFIGQGMAGGAGFIDIGAHAGIFTIAAAQAFPDRQVIAVEPLPANFEWLLRNIRLNRLDNVEPVRAAVSDRSGSVPFFVNPLQDGGGSLRAFDSYRTGNVAVDARAYQQAHPRFQERVPVETRGLDELVRGPSVLKVDVEGGELEVLRSGSEALRSGWIDMAVIELDEETVRETVALLDEAGFDCFQCGRRLPMTPETRLRFRIENIVALRRGSALHREVDFA